MRALLALVGVAALAVLVGVFQALAPRESLEER